MTAPAAAPEPVVVIDEIGGNCPVQAHGTIAGVPFYFRARGEHWSIEIGPGNAHRCVESAGAARGLDCWDYEERYGDWPSAGWMSEDEARAFIARGARLWRAERPEMAAPLSSSRETTTGGPR